MSFHRSSYLNHPSHHNTGIATSATMLGFTQPLGDPNAGPLEWVTNTLPTGHHLSAGRVYFFIPGLRSLASLQATISVDVYLTSASQKNFQGPLYPEEAIGGDWMLDRELSGLISPGSQVVWVLVDKALLAVSPYLRTFKVNNSRIKWLPQRPCILEKLKYLLNGFL